MQFRRMRISNGLIALSAVLCLGAASAENDYAAAARDLDATIAKQYAYLEKLPDGQLPDSDVLTSEREEVHDGRTLLAYAEKRITSLADHHAITGSSFSNSWAVVPTYADLWIVARDGRFIVDAVRESSPAANAGISVGDAIVAIEGTPTRQAVAEFWEALGLSATPTREEYAARVLVAGRRDRARKITVQNRSGRVRELVLNSMYDEEQEARPPISICDLERFTVVRFNNSLGEFASIEAFDQAMKTIPKDHALVLDLRDTPSGGNTTVARAVMGWFVTEGEAYQVHNRPAEERETGVPRQWIEQVLPREGKYRSSLPTILVGRWTGSMGEGIAVGFDALGAEVLGTRMAGLKGSIEDLRVGDTNLSVKLPTERLLTVAGLPREEFVPRDPPSDILVPGSC